MTNQKKSHNSPKIKHIFTKKNIGRYGWRINLTITSLVMSFFIVSTASTPFPLTAPEKTNYISANSNPNSNMFPQFKDLTLAAGLNFTHNQIDQHLTGIDETLAPGACALDYNNDGWMDLFLVNGSGQTRFYRRKSWWQKKQGHALYKNNGDGTFQNVTINSGIDQSSWGMGCVSSDFDNDGYADLFITNLGKNHLYKNNQDGTFSNVSHISGMTNEVWSTSATVADYDGDGLLDIYVANYIDFQKGAKTYEAQSQYKNRISAAFTPTLYDALPNKLYRNQGDFRFEDTTFQAGVEDSNGRSLDAIWLDANGDQRPDIYVNNAGGGGSNTLLINQGNGAFSELSNQNNLGSAMGHHSTAAGDIDNDGDLDLMVTGSHRQAHLLLINEQDNRRNSTWQFSDKAKGLGLTENQFVGFSGWSTGLQDFNNDGWLDIFIANGLTTADPDSNKISQGQSKQLWLNQGDGSFRDISQKAGKALHDMESARGAVYADFDNDGDIDIYVAHNNNLGQLLVNQSPSGQQWLGIQLIGTQSNRDAIGTRVRVNKGDMTQLRVSSRGNSFLSSNDPRLHFGLGSTTAPISITVGWPNGNTNVFDGIIPNQYLVITQGETTPVSISKHTTPKQKPRNRLSLTIGATSPHARSQYIQWLTAHTSDYRQALSEIEIALQDNTTSVRLAAIKALHKKSDDGLRLLVQSLDDNAADVRRAAVLTLRDDEQEASVRWLLRMFDDTDDQVRMATANSFAFFFREEEAVAHRKYLAIPKLLELLNDNNPKVVVSAIRALGDAEQFRAVSPLTRLLNSHELSIKKEAIRALGLLREQQAIKPLLKLLSTEIKEPVIISSLFIALKRLAYPEITSLFNSLLDIKHSTDVLIGLKSIEAILRDNRDSTVFNHAELINIIDDWYFQEKTQQHVLAQDKNEAQINQEIIGILLHAGVSAPERLGTQLIQSSHPNVRAKAYTALFKYKTPSRTAFVSLGVNDSTHAVKNVLLHSAGKGNIDLDLSFILDALKSEETVLAAITALIRYPTSEVANTLHSLIHDESANNTTRIKALGVLSGFSGSLPALDDTLLIHKNSAIRAASLRYWHIQHNQHIRQEHPPKPLALALKDENSEVVIAAFDITLSHNAPWARQAIFEVLSNQSFDVAIKANIIKKLSQSREVYAPALLIKTAADPLNSASNIAMKSLLSLQSPLVENFMWQQLINKKSPDEHRLLAAESLLLKHGEDVIHVLQGKARASRQ